MTPSIYTQITKVSFQDRRTVFCYDREITAKKLFMLCPNCNQELKEVRGISHYGSTIKLNQCNNCGGIWFDKWELFTLEEKEVKKLENVEIDKFRESYSNDKKEKLCPVCNLSLMELKDPNIPSKINIESCQKCDGFWMNHGETTKYKKYQGRKIKESTIRRKKPDELDEQIQKLFKLQSSDNVLGGIAAFLSTRLDRSTLRPIREPGDEYSTTDKAADLTANLATNVLTILFRSMIH